MVVARQSSKVVKRHFLSYCIFVGQMIMPRGQMKFITRQKKNYLKKNHAWMDNHRRVRWRKYDSFYMKLPS